MTPQITYRSFARGEDESVARTARADCGRRPGRAARARPRRVAARAEEHNQPVAARERAHERGVDSHTSTSESTRAPAPRASGCRPTCRSPLDPARRAVASEGKSSQFQELTGMGQPTHSTLQNVHEKATCHRSRATRIERVKQSKSQAVSITG